MRTIPACRPAGRRLAGSAVAAILLIAGAAPAQPPRPAPPPVERVSAPPPPAPGAADSLARPDFSGVWVLNEKESDDPAPVFAALMPANATAAGKDRRPGGRPGIGVRGRSSGGVGPGGGGPGGPGMGSGGMGDDLGGADQDGDVSRGQSPSAAARFGGTGGDDAAAARARQNFGARMAAAWQRLLIAQSGAEVEIVDGSEQSRVHVLDGQRRDRRGTRAAMLETARWEGPTMVITVEQEGRPGMTQVYRLDPEAKRLYVTLRLPVLGPGGEKVIRLVYESA